MDPTRLLLIFITVIVPHVTFVESETMNLGISTSCTNFIGPTHDGRHYCQFFRTVYTCKNQFGINNVWKFPLENCVSFIKPTDLSSTIKEKPSNQLCDSVRRVNGFAHCGQHVVKDNKVTVIKTYKCKDPLRVLNLMSGCIVIPDQSIIYDVDYGFKDSFRA